MKPLHILALGLALLVLLLLLGCMQLSLEPLAYEAAPASLNGCKANISLIDGDAMTHQTLRCVEAVALAQWNGSLCRFAPIPNYNQCSMGGGRGLGDTVCVKYDQQTCAYLYATDADDKVVGNTSAVLGYMSDPMLDNRVGLREGFALAAVMNKSDLVRFYMQHVPAEKRWDGDAISRALDHENAGMVRQILLDEKDPCLRLQYGKLFDSFVASCDKEMFNTMMGRLQTCPRITEPQSAIFYDEDFYLDDAPFSEEMANKTRDFEVRCGPLNASHS